MDDAPKCSTCGQRPPRAERSLVEILVDKHLCDVCWGVKVDELKSGDLDRKAQAQYDKMMRDMQNGMDPMDAWDKKGESDA